jgi:chromosome partitioning protein
MSISSPPRPLAGHAPDGDIDGVITLHAQELSEKLQAHRLELFPPSAEKTLRSFQVSEAAKLLGVKSGYLRNLSLEGKGPDPQVTPSGRRSYTAEQIRSLRHYLDENGRAAKRYVPWRRGKEALQVVAVVNFKGGSGKTTTAAHLAQHLALRGHRVLAIDLDPQASLSSLHGFQPELDVGENETLYAAIRYDEHARPLREIIKKTNFPGLDIVPGNIELMEFEYDTPRVLAAREGPADERLFFARLDEALRDVADDYDVAIIDCPPQLGYLTMSALCTATAILITVHPQMLDVMSMCQFLLMMGDLLSHLKRAGGNMGYDWLRYLITRYEPSDGPQTQMVSFLRSLFGQHVLINAMLKSVAISDAGITKQTLYEVERRQFTAATYDRAIEALDAVNGEIEQLIHMAWGRR